MIKASNLYKIYNQNRNPFTALEDVTIDIPSNTSLALIGKSGSGKSTLMHLLAGLDSPTKGEVIFDGSNLSDLSAEEKNSLRNQKVGFVFQSFFILPDETVFENIATPLRISKLSKKKIDQRVNSIIEQVGLKDKASNNVIDLSGGQKQRVCVARALVTEPSVIFADEPTGNLDSETGEKIEDLLFEMREKVSATLVIVTHDQQLANRCSAQVELKDGKIINNNIQPR